MAVARCLDDIHLVSADSMQVYRHMDIGTAKPTAGGAGRGTAPLHRPGRTDHRLHRGGVQGGPCRRARRHRLGRGRRADRRGHRPLSPSRDRRLRPPGGVARDPGGTRRRERQSCPPPTARIARPGGSVEDRTVEPPPRRQGARGDARQRPTLQFVRSRRRQLSTDATWCRSASAVPALFSAS